MPSIHPCLGVAPFERDHPQRRVRAPCDLREGRPGGDRRGEIHGDDGARLMGDAATLARVKADFAATADLPRPRDRRVLQAPVARPRSRPCPCGMRLRVRIWLVIAALNGALAVALGAVAAHALAQRLNVHELSLFETAARYHMYHALALGLAALAMQGAATRRALCAACAFMGGIVLFSGSLYLYALTQRTGSSSSRRSAASRSSWAGCCWRWPPRGSAHERRARPCRRRRASQVSAWHLRSATRGA